MAVGILIITHDGIGPALLGTASLMLTECPLEAKLLNASADGDPEQLEMDAVELVDQLDQGDGVLILTDLAGSTPSNIAARIAQGRHDIRIVSGINMSMLIRLFNYPDCNLDELMEKALSGGRDGITRV
jgi:PTS system ascorbate-specific IIA component